jgi:hypothetical protein
LLIQGFYSQHGIELEPLQIALWALPTAIAAFVIHAFRTVLFARRIRNGAIDSAPFPDRLRNRPASEQQDMLDTDQRG